MPGGEVGGAVLEETVKTVAPAVESTVQAAAPITTELSSTPITPEIANLEQTVDNLKQAEITEPQTDSNTSPEAETKVSTVNNINPGEKAQEENPNNKGPEDQLPAEKTPITSGSENQEKKDLQNDPLYQKKLGEATNRAISSGEPLDGKKLQEEALANYQQEKDLQNREKAEEPQAEKISKTEARLKSLEDKIGELSAENAELKQNMTELVSAMKEIMPMMLMLVQAEQLREQDPKKKESLVKILLKLVGVMALSVFTEGAKTVVPPSS